MNKAQQLLLAIKQLFDSSMPQTPAPPAPTVYKTKEGQEISCTKLEVGGMATMAGAPAPAGSYTLEDGTVLTTDATGLITTVTPVVPAAAAAPPVAPPAIPAAPLPFASTPPVLTDELKTPEGIRALYEKFAAGTPEERIGNLELVAKALMEYAFGWELKQAKEAQDKAAALKVYNDSLVATQAQVTSQQDLMKQMMALMEEVVGLPAGDPPTETKKKFSFANTDSKRKSIEKFKEAAKRMAEEANKN